VRALRGCGVGGDPRANDGGPTARMSRRASTTDPERVETEDRTVQAALVARRRNVRVHLLTHPRPKPRRRGGGR